MVAKAKFSLDSEEATYTLGQKFAKALNPDNKDCIGFIAGVETGKSTLVRGIHEGLRARYGYFETMMMTLTGKF